VAQAPHGKVFEVQVERVRGQRVGHRIGVFAGAQRVGRVKADAHPLGVGRLHDALEEAGREAVVVFDGQPHVVAPNVNQCLADDADHLVHGWFEVGVVDHEPDEG
jgi:hypothetical protein